MESVRGLQAHEGAVADVEARNREGKDDPREDKRSIGMNEVCYLRVSEVQRLLKAAVMNVLS